MIRSVWCATAFVSLAVLAAKVEAQPGLTVVRALTQPADPIVKSAKGKPIPLPDLAKRIAKTYKLKVTVDEAAFAAAAPTLDLAKTGVTIPTGPGLRLATVLHYCLEEDLPVRATFKIRGDELVIHPGATQVVQAEDKTGPAGKRLDATYILYAKEARAPIGEVLKVVEAKSGLPVLVANRRFAEAERTDFLTMPVTVAKQAKVPLAKSLQDILGQAGATFHVRTDHILVVPKGK